MFDGLRSKVNLTLLRSQRMKHWSQACATQPVNLLDKETDSLLGMLIFVGLRAAKEKEADAFVELKCKILGECQGAIS